MEKKNPQTNALRRAEQKCIKNWLEQLKMLSMEINGNGNTKRTSVKVGGGAGLRDILYPLFRHVDPQKFLWFLVLIHPWIIEILPEIH